MSKFNYSCISLKGKIRTENQDSFFCCGSMPENDTSAVSGSCGEGIFAVFDGMGGCCDGKKAAWLCSDHISRNSDRIAASPSEMINVLLEMNGIVCAHAAENKYSVCGSTAVMALVKDSMAYISNIGDSRAYLFSEGLYRLSCDHVRLSSGRKGLTQYVGIPERELMLEPYFGSVKLEYGSRLLLCSDGLSDMIDDNFISSCLSMKSSVGDICLALSDEAMKNGGRDNITVIVIEREC